MTSYRLHLRINGTAYDITTDVRSTLLDLLRERLQLTGTKKGCDHGLCGACTVSVNGERVVSCLTLAASIDGSDVLTIEGIADGDRLHPLQEAFLDCDGEPAPYHTRLSTVATRDPAETTTSSITAPARSLSCQPYPRSTSEVGRTVTVESRSGRCSSILARAPGDSRAMKA